MSEKVVNNVVLPIVGLISIIVCVYSILFLGVIQ
jgi:hypothetical protein